MTSMKMLSVLRNGIIDIASSKSSATPRMKCTPIKPQGENTLTTETRSQEHGETNKVSKDGDLNKNNTHLKRSARKSEHLPSQYLQDKLQAAAAFGCGVFRE